MCTLHSAKRVCNRFFIKIFRDWIFEQFIFRFFSISFRNDYLIALMNWHYEWSSRLVRECLCKSLSKLFWSKQMRQTWKSRNENRKNDEKERNWREKFSRIYEISKTSFLKHLIIELKQKMSNILYNEMNDFLNRIETKTVRVNFASVCCWKFFDFEFFRLWLIDIFWLTANIK